MVADKGDIVLHPHYFGGLLVARAEFVFYIGNLCDKRMQFFQSGYVEIRGFFNRIIGGNHLRKRRDLFGNLIELRCNRIRLQLLRIFEIAQSFSEFGYFRKQFRLVLFGCGYSRNALLEFFEMYLFLYFRKRIAYAHARFFVYGMNLVNPSGYGYYFVVYVGGVFVARRHQKFEQFVYALGYGVLIVRKQQTVGVHQIFDCRALFFKLFYSRRNALLSVKYLRRVFVLNRKAFVKHRRNVFGLLAHQSRRFRVNLYGCNPLFKRFEIFAELGANGFYLLGKLLVAHRFGGLLVESALHALANKRNVFEQFGAVCRA